MVLCEKDGEDGLRDRRSSIWTGELPDGSHVVGLFNREDEAMEYGIDFAGDLGISGGTAQVRDMWGHADLGTMSGGFRRKLAPHSCMILKITPKEMPRGGFGCSRHL